MLPTTLEGFTRHAQLYGVECVYETALEYLALDELDELETALRFIDKKWRLDRRTALRRDLRRERETRTPRSTPPKTPVKWAENRSYGPPPTLNRHLLEKPGPAAGCWRCGIKLRPFASAERARAWAYKHTGTAKHKSALLEEAA